jgi:FxLD family lantipeptide
MRTDLATVPASIASDVEPAIAELDLMIRIAPAPAVSTMWSKTDDGCGRTCESACPNTGC